MKVICCVFQGSIIGPTLWNIYHDEVLSSTVTTVEYADDLGILVLKKNGRIVEVTANRSIRQIIMSPTRKKLSLAPQKIEVVLLIAGIKIKTITVEVGETRITSQKDKKYLGLRFNRNRTIRHHV